MAISQSVDSSFKKQVLDQEGIVFVDFYASWCGPCKMTSPIIDELARSEKYKDKVKFVKLDVDEHQELASQYGIFSIPTFVIFKGGKVVSQFVGAHDKAMFEKEINKILEGAS